MYSIDEFWIPTLGRASEALPTMEAPAGWTSGVKIEKFNSFIEAPLEPAEAFENETSRSIILVSAPGAVGKSTLAREIASRTGAILVDLSRASAVGASSISGGLAWAGLFEQFLRGDVALLIDGLDEARIRVTQDSFVAFLEDISKLASADRRPITLFGRTSAIEDAYLHLMELDLIPPVLEIQFHGPDAAIELVTRRISHIRNKNNENEISTRHADRRSAEKILQNLAFQANDDGDRFVGYAPVLIAVAKRISGERNPQVLLQALESGVESLSLNQIVDDILERERSKLDPLEFSDPGLKEHLYGKTEQVERLISAVYGIDYVPILPAMSQQDAETYHSALEDWVPDHPFTDGSGKRPSSEVFGAFLIAEALKTEWARLTVRTKELGGPKVNPFIWRFRLPERWVESEEMRPEEVLEFVPLSELGLVFTSLQAQLPRLESAHMHIDADPCVDDSQNDSAEVEISRYFDGEARVVRLSTEHSGAVYFGSRISDVYISGSELDVVACGKEITFAAPVDLDVGSIDAGPSGLVIEGSRRYTGSSPAVVRLRSSVFNWSSDNLSVRPSVELAVNWPGSEFFPWHNYRKPDTPDGFDPILAERLRRLRKILVLFRARGMGQLAKFKGAIDHGRRIRGSGAAVRNLLLEERILFEDGRVYVLDTDRLSEVLGLTFLEIQSAIVNAKTIAFLKRV